MKNKFIILTIILFSGFVLLVALLAERYFKLSTIQIREETLKKETFRLQNVDRELIKIALQDGYFPIIHPKAYQDDPFLKLVDGLPPLGANPYTNHYLCNEGYGLIKIKSDRFGLRNDDEIWDNINLLENKVLLIGGSFAHGACVDKEDSIAGNINGNIFNVAMGDSDPHIYNANINVFLNHIKPENVVIVIYANNDFRLNKKNNIFDKIISKQGYVCGNQPCEKIIQTSIDAENLLIKMKKVQGKRQSFMTRLIEYFNFEYLRKKINFVKRRYFVNDLNLILKKLALNSKEKCRIANCNLFFVYIPNSETYRPNILAKSNRESLFVFLKEHNIKYIDMNRYFKNLDINDLYAVQGMHLSPKGYKLVAEKINDYISNK